MALDRLTVFSGNANPKLADDIVKDVGGDGGGAGPADFRRDGLGHLEIEVGRFEGELAGVATDENVGQNRNRIPPLHHAMNVAQRLK